MEEFNARAKQVLEQMRQYSSQYHIKTIGSEFLILSMFDTEDSLCHFLLTEYDITREDILEQTENIFILRKENGEWNTSFETILHQAQLLASDGKISEEHLFMAVLMCRNTIACAILEALELNIDELIIDVKEIYDFDNQSVEELSYVRNISKLAKNKELSTFVQREEYIKRLDVILHRKYKNNPLLIGNAGVGKTAIVEGYAQKLSEEKSDVSILSLNLTAMLAGTRYRGDFEERFDRFVKEIAGKKNVIIFIDEIHTIMGAATTEGNLDVANMLKPFLARNGIKLIGATTIEEYHKTIAKDKALSRRFQALFVHEPTMEETKKILYGIKEDYEQFHQVNISSEVLDYLMLESDRQINRKFRPDKCIDILDDLLATAHLFGRTEVTLEDVDHTIQAYLGNGIPQVHKELSFPKLAQYDWLFHSHLLEEKPLLRLNYVGNKTGLFSLLEDCKTIFNIGDEAILNLDLQAYRDSFMMSGLVGAPPGYVGYEDEGILSKHILSYPLSVLVFKNFKYAHPAIQSFIVNMLSSGVFTDQRGRSISLEHVVIIVEGTEEKMNIGFKKNNVVQSDTIFDEVLCRNSTQQHFLNREYEKALSRLHYEISFDFDIEPENKKKVNSYLYEFTQKNKYGKYVIKKEDIFDI